MALSLMRGRRVTLTKVDAFADGVAVKQASKKSPRPLTHPAVRPCTAARGAALATSRMSQASPLICYRALNSCLRRGKWYLLYMAIQLWMIEEISIFSSQASPSEEGLPSLRRWAWRPSACAGAYKGAEDICCLQGLSTGD